MTQQASGRFGNQAEAHGIAQDMRAFIGERYHNVEEIVSNHPATAGLVVFGLGLGVGLIMGSSIAAASRPRRSPWIDARRAERFGRHMFDLLAEHLPESLSKRLS